MRQNRTIFPRTLAAALLLGGVALALPAAEKDPISARHDVMEDTGTAMKALGAIAKQKVPFDLAVVKSHAATIAKHMTEAASLFPEGSDKGARETFAKPEVWSDRPGFEAALKATQEAAAALQVVQDEAGFRPALGNLGTSCKACHDKYRRPEH
jgi:cytochrome c556